MTRRTKQPLTVGAMLALSAGILFIVAAGVTVGLVNKTMRQHVLDCAEAKALLLLDRNLATHTYFSHQLKPKVFELTNALCRAYGFRSRATRILIVAKDTLLHIDQAVPVGLIVNELVSNALKHAFPGEKSGTVEIAVRDLPEGYMQISVSDDGVGLPDGVDPESGETLGLLLVRKLSEDQLGGVLDIERDGGTRFTVTFKRRKTAERN